MNTKHWWGSLWLTGEEAGVRVPLLPQQIPHERAWIGNKTYLHASDHLSWCWVGTRSFVIFVASDAQLSALRKLLSVWTSRSRNTSNTEAAKNRPMDDGDYSVWIIVPTEIVAVLGYYAGDYGCDWTGSGSSVWCERCWTFGFWYHRVSILCLSCILW